MNYTQGSISPYPHLLYLQYHKEYHQVGNLGTVADPQFRHTLIRQIFRRIFRRVHLHIIQSQVHHDELHRRHQHQEVFHRGVRQHRGHCLHKKLEI